MPSPTLPIISITSTSFMTYLLTKREKKPTNSTVFFFCIRFHRVPFFLLPTFLAGTPVSRIAIFETSATSTNCESVECFKRNLMVCQQKKKTAFDDDERQVCSCSHEYFRSLQLLRTTRVRVTVNSKQ